MSEIHPKYYLHSRTLWFNVAMTVLTFVADQNGLLRELLSDRGYLLLMLLTGLGNAYLRTVTNKPVTFK